jgi:Polyketide cyclase / dehydrase and lipid transport
VTVLATRALGLGGDDDHTERSATQRSKGLTIGIDERSGEVTGRRRQDSVSIDIGASPEEVYALVSDITRMGEWSPECRECVWVRGARGPVEGARFKARNKGRRGPSWLTWPVVTVAEPARAFAFNRSGPGIGSYTWRYTLEPTATGTRLTESYQVEKPIAPVVNWVTHRWVGSKDRDGDLHEGMTVTLQRIKEAAEAATPPVRTS